MDESILCIIIIIIVFVVLVSSNDLNRETMNRIV